MLLRRSRDGLSVCYGCPFRWSLATIVRCQLITAHDNAGGTVVSRVAVAVDMRRATPKSLLAHWATVCVAMADLRKLATVRRSAARSFDSVAQVQFAAR